jgi:hypothetical protein
MNKSKLEIVQSIVNKISTGSFDFSHVGLLLIILRFNFSKDSLLAELAHFVAHDERDRGISFRQIDFYVRNIIDVSERGGTIFGLPPIFNKTKVIEDLMKMLSSLGIIYDEDSVREQKEKIISELLYLIDEIKFEFDDPRIVKCFLKREGDKSYFCLNLDLKGPRIFTSPEATIRGELFN